MEITLANQLSIAYPKEDMREFKNGRYKMEHWYVLPRFWHRWILYTLSSQYVVKDLKDKKKLTLLRNNKN